MKQIYIFLGQTETQFAPIDILIAFESICTSWPNKQKRGYIIVVDVDKTKEIRRKQCSSIVILVTHIHEVKQYRSLSDKQIIDNNSRLINYLCGCSYKNVYLEHIICKSKLSFLNTRLI